MELIQIDFFSPEGRCERLWAQTTSHETACVLSVPVWIYGISRGTIVRYRRDDKRTFSSGVQRESDGGTIRFLASEGLTGKAVYLTRVVPTFQKQNLGVGPATFLGPRFVAMNVHKKATWWPQIGSYLEKLSSDGIIETWEASDPDQDADAPTTPSEDPERVFIHQLPIDNTDMSFI